MSIKFSQAIDFIRKAQKLDEQQLYREAIILYESGVRHLIDALEYEIKGETAREAIAEKCQQFSDRVQELRESESGGGRIARTVV
ncbi:MIT domain-containing protein [Sergentomyia squamirostris]